MSEKGKTWEPQLLQPEIYRLSLGHRTQFGKAAICCFGVFFFQMWLILKTEQLFLSWNPVSNLKTATGSESVFPQVEAQEAPVYSAGLWRSGGNRSLEALGQLFPTRKRFSEPPL